MTDNSSTSRTGGLFPTKFTLTIEEHPTLGWVVTSDAHSGFMVTIMPEEGLPEGLRKVPGQLRQILVAQIDADNDRRRQPMSEGPPARSQTTITIELDRKTDGRWIAEVREVPGCLAYGATRLDAVRQALALFDDVVTPDVE